MAFVQSGWLRITTPLGENKLMVGRLEGEERISGLFHFQLELSSTDDSLDPAAIVGKDATVSLLLPGSKARYINGVISRFAQGGKDARFTTYFADLRPWLWLLTLKSDSRIFQNKTTPDILQQIFSEPECGHYKNALKGSYRSREYCVQYQETSLAFVSRLMEEEGIFYFFEHQSDRHTLVVADDPSAYLSCPGLDVVRLRPRQASREELDAVLECSLEHSVAPIHYQANDYNFTTPSTSLLSEATTPHAESISPMAHALHTDTPPAIYEYPGRYATATEGSDVADKRLSAFEAQRTILRGVSTCRAFQPGCKFTLSDHYRRDVNTEYVLLSVTHRATAQDYSNTFEAIPAKTPYRPLLQTPRPKIPGTQTAVVVGKAGEEIWTDQYGRIKVKFHWDRDKARDETSSCWVRVAQGWAGKGWGSLFIPRLGQEVVVSFLDGDPDRPLVTGCVYNAQQVVPYSLPGEQSKSTVKTNSTKGGNGFNELRFEDKAGSEEVYLHAQKDLSVQVLGSETRTVQKSRSATIQEADDSLTVAKGNRIIAVQEGNESHEVKGKRDLTVTGNETHTNKADFAQTVSGNFTLKVSGNLSIEVSGSVKIKAGTSLNAEAGTSLTNKAGTDLTNEAGTSLTNKAGTTMSHEANISISSKANASQTVESDGLVSVKGSLVKIN